MTGAVKKIQQSVQSSGSMICVGLDFDPRKLPELYRDSLKGMYQFADRIIDATQDIVCAYKPNLGFYEAFGPDGLSLLKLVCKRIPDNRVIILDGKRGDIGNTAEFYARAMFEIYGADWVTINPYMGYDSVRPFILDKERGAFVLCLTSNPGARDFQRQEIAGKPLYRHVARQVVSWNKSNNCGLVVGATHPEQLIELRKVAEDMPLLIPGVGAQGGDLEKAAVGGTDGFRKPAIINVSRSVLYASSGPDFDEAARKAIHELNHQIASFNKGVQPAP